MNARTNANHIDEQFIQRWSPRAFAGVEMPASELHKILEAASYAPSAFNAQPWRFIYALRGTAHWDTLLNLLNDFNKSWASNASALVVILSKTTSLPPGGTEETPFLTHSFDTGAAWGYLALQASNAGWPAHAMAGFDKDKARSVFAIPDNYKVEAMVAIGKQGDKAILPAGLQEREQPSPRLPLNKVAFEGKFENS